MKNFKPRKSVKRFICETLISALVLTVILGIIYYQERLWVLAMVLIFILDVLFCMFEEIKEYRIDDDGTVHVVCYLGFSKVVLKGITKVYFDILPGFWISFSLVISHILPLLHFLLDNAISTFCSFLPR